MDRKTREKKLKKKESERERQKTIEGSVTSK